jgi:hydrogenase nickel incorporation protein HypA/HybF
MKSPNCWGPQRHTPMHEFSIATTLVEDVLKFAKEHGATKVVRVRLGIGELTCIQSEQLKFCYESVITETALAESKLEIETIPARVACSNCGYQGPPKYWLDSLADVPIATFQCPTCAKSVEAIQGHECAIKTIQFVA